MVPTLDLEKIKELRFLLLIAISDADPVENMHHKLFLRWGIRAIIGESFAEIFMATV